ncbi:DUF167 domain-containing protein [Candidatus Parcubacteria bacterium]|nr:DUF167 domain-containing protein [Candidatus Parcubacteria bacterium]
MQEYIQKLNKNKELYLRIKVRPGAIKTVFKSMLDDDTLKIDVAAIPEKGKANKELIKYLANEFVINKNNVKIISGAGDKLKLVKLVKV